MSTPYFDELYKSVDFDRELVFKFFAVFSLFEYALKSAGFRNESGDAMPDWEIFARKIEKRFNPKSSPEIEEAVKYLFEKPPKRQVVHGTLGWQERTRPAGKTDCEWLSLIIRAVRNNLFHGGKFIYERPRDTLLIQHSLTILEAWAKADYRIKRALTRVR
jgi:hypothetical protein